MRKQLRTTLTLAFMFLSAVTGTLCSSYYYRHTLDAYRRENTELRAEQDVYNAAKEVASRMVVMK